MPKSVAYKKGSIIYFEGDRDNSIYIVQTGSVISQSTNLENGNKVNERLGPGEFFGVKSALAKMPRMNTIQVPEDSVVIVLTVQEFEVLFSPKKPVMEKMLRVFSKTLRDIHKQTDAILHNDTVSIPVENGMMMVAKAFFDDDEFFTCADILERLLTNYPSTENKDAAESLLADAKKKAEEKAKSQPTVVNTVEEQKSDTSLNQFSAPIFERFTKNYPKGSVIVCEYEPGETFYLIKSGEVQIVKTITGQNKNLDIVHKGEFFGEMAVLDKSQRSATCVARTDVSCLEFNKENFGSLVLGNKQLVMSLLKLFCKRIYDQQRRFKIILIKDLQIRMMDIFLMYDEVYTTPEEDEVQKQRRTFNLTVNDLAHWGGISVSSAREELMKLSEKKKVELFDGYINVINIHDMKRTVDSYYNAIANGTLKIEQEPEAEEKVQPVEEKPAQEPAPAEASAEQPAENTQESKPEEPAPSEPQA